MAALFLLVYPLAVFADLVPRLQEVIHAALAKEGRRAADPGTQG